MVQLCAAIWSNILKGQQRGAGASSGKGNQVIIGNQISERQEPLIESFASCFTVLSAHGTQHATGGRRGLAWLLGTWWKGRASSSMLSAQRGLFTGQRFLLYTCSDTLSLFIHPNPKFGFVINCHIGSPCKRAIAAPEGQRLFSPGCSWGLRWAELPGQAPWQCCCPLM